MMKQLFVLLFCSTVLLFACQQSQNRVVVKDLALDHDAVCGMKVDPSWSDTAHYQGKIYGFCSQSCKETFAENPQSYLEETPEQH